MIVSTAFGISSIDADVASHRRALIIIMRVWLFCGFLSAAAIWGRASGVGCAAGLYQLMNGSCSGCSNGKHSPVAGTFHVPLGANIIAANIVLCSGLSGCLDCAFGYYAASPGQTACTACPASMTTWSEGAVTRASCRCKPGHYLQDTLATLLASTLPRKVEHRVPTAACQRTSTALLAALSTCRS